MSSQYLTHIVGIGDTIQSIGHMYNVDWTELVAVNGLEYPYIDDDLYLNEHQDIDKVAKVGSVLVVPTNGLKIPVKTNNSSEELENYALGCDLDLFTLDVSEKGIINLEVEGQLSSDEKGDLKIAKGIDNLRQQLTIRLGTPKGTLLLHPEFGSNLLSFIGKKVTEELLTEVGLEVEECMLSDFRVQEVSNLQVIFKEHGIHVECCISPISPYPSFQFGHTFTE